MAELATIGKATTLAASSLGLLLLGGLAYSGTSAVQAAHVSQEAPDVSDDDVTHDVNGDADDVDAVDSPAPGGTTDESGVGGSDGAQGSSADEHDETSSDPNAQTDPDRDSGQSPSQDGDIIEDNVIHIIQYGETLTSISADYGVPIGILAQENHITNVDMIYADAAMLIPYASLEIPVDWND